MTELVTIKNLTKTFGQFTAVDNISLSVKQGDVLGFLGPNGAGKSTTMRMATGYLAPTSGTISICDHDITTAPLEAQKHVGYLPEGGPLYLDMTPCSFLEFISDIRKLEGSFRKERLDYVIENLHLDQVYYQPIETLSKGYKRRVALAQAIIHDPKVLILDEPTDGLDPNQKFEVQKLIQSMAKDKSIIISTHILEEVEAVCNKAMIIAKGQLLAKGTPDDIAKHSPLHQAVVLKLGTKPTDTELKELKNIKDVENAEVSSDDDNTIIITPKSGRTIVGAVSQVAHKKNYDVQEIYAKAGGLTDAFRHITTKDQPQSEGEAA